MEFKNGNTSSFLSRAPMVAEKVIMRLSVAQKITQLFLNKFQNLNFSAG
jgi:hypothetical protein